MFHFRPLFQHCYSQTVRNLTLGLMASSAATLGSMTPAHAAMTQISKVRQELSQTKLSLMNGADVNRIDWRQPVMKLRFDLSDSDWIDGMDLILSMTPSGNVGKREPILVSLNNSAPLRLNTYGQSFDARLQFDPTFIHAKGNVLTIRVPAPSGAPCLTSGHGSWDVNVQKSSIVVRTRPKSRSLYLREVVERLKNPATAPKTVSILATGSEKARYEMLGAQGIALQSAAIPNFRTRSGNSDMEVIIGRRDELSSLVSDRTILSETGSKISVHKGRPMRLVITGDTDHQVSEAVKAFASHNLPPVRRRQSSTGELNFQRSFQNDHVELSGRTRFSKLDEGYYAMDWRETPNILTFNVADPAMQSGEILLRLSTGEKIRKDSQVKLELNGKSLGFAALDRKRKTVSFDIAEGMLRGHDNTLKITPILNKNPTVDTFGQSCPNLDDTPGFYIGDGSRIDLKSSSVSPVTELSRLTANGGLFAKNAGHNTHIILPARRQNDYNASLKVLAKLAKSSGAGWTEATVSRELNDIDGKHILIVGPKASSSAVLDSAPRSLSAALTGKSTTGQLISNAGAYEKFASNDAARTLKLYAEKTRSSSRIGSGGVAAVFPDQQRLIGVISNTPGRSFASVSQDLLKTKQWNSLRGSVARWNSKAVLMAQTSISAPSVIDHAPSYADKGLLMTMADFDTAWLEDRFVETKDKILTLTDTSSIRLEALLNDFILKLPGSGSLKQAPSQRSVYAGETAPVFVPLIHKRPTAQRPTLKPASAKTEAGTTAALVAKLRGFSTPDSLGSAQSRGPHWFSKLWASLKNKVQTLTPPALNSADETAASPVMTLHPKAQPTTPQSMPSKISAWSNMFSGYLSVLLGLAIILFGLILSLMMPDPAPKPDRLYWRDPR